MGKIGISVIATTGYNDEILSSLTVVINDFYCIRKIIPNLNEHYYKEKKNRLLGLIKYIFKKMGSFGITMYDLNSIIT